MIIIIIDFLVINLSNIFLASVLLSIFKLNDRKLYIILVTDLILHQTPLITLIILAFYYLKIIIFKYIRECFLTRYLLLVGDYFIFGILLYGIYNGLDRYIINFLINHLLLNLLVFYLGMKYLVDTYN